MRLFSRPQKPTSPIYCDSPESLARVLGFLQRRNSNYVSLFNVQAWLVKGSVVGYWIDVEEKIADEVHKLAVLRS